MSQRVPPRQGVSRITHRGIAAEAAARIQDAIFDGHFPPGAPLLEAELADSMGISRGSVREGLAQLEREGIVVTAWHRPSRVIDVTRDDAVELYALRSALDLLAASSAAQADSHDPIRAALAELEESSRSGADFRELLRLDLRLHDAIYRVAGNSRLEQAWRAIRSQVELFQTRRLLNDVEDYRERLIQEHREIADLISAGPSERLDACVAAHVSSALTALVKGLDG
ncbi:GntR family transcriptional regulator [Mycolicibacterium sp.]|uniref:GntR family transcriptional regulator n=1 Tax=Mycolicibacterium sp. TaxID=2320850 RepID=UPI003D13C663